MNTYRYKLLVTKKLNNGKFKTTITNSRSLLPLNRLYNDKLNTEKDNIEQMAIYDYDKMKYVKYYEKEGNEEDEL